MPRVDRIVTRPPFSLLPPSVYRSSRERPRAPRGSCTRAHIYINQRYVYTRLAIGGHASRVLLSAPLSLRFCALARALAGKDRFARRGNTERRGGTGTGERRERERREWQQQTRGGGRRNERKSELHPRALSSPNDLIALAVYN